MRRTSLAAAVAITIAAVTASIVLLAGEDPGKTDVSIGPGGGTVSKDGVTLVVPSGAVSREVALRVERGGAEAADRLLPGMRPLAPVYSIELDPDLTLRRPVRVHFDVDEIPRGPLFVASREAVGEMWTLRRASAASEGNEVVVAVDGFSLLQPLEDLAGRAAAGTETAAKTLLRLGGARASEPRCGPPPFGYQLAGDTGADDANALIFACLEGSGSDLALHVVNNRAIGMKHSLPQGTRVSSLTSPALSDALMDAVRNVQRGMSWRSISAAGEVVLTGEARKLEVTVEPTLSSFAFDLALFAIGEAGGKMAKAAATVNYLECVREAADRLGAGPPRSAGEALDAALGVWRLCGDTLARVGKGALAKAGAVFFGGIKLGAGTTDAAAELLTQQRARLSVEKAPPAVLGFSTDGAVEAVGPFSVSSGARTIADAVAVFGPPASIEPGSTGCEVLWPELGLKADAVNYGSRSSECAPEGGYINDFVIDSPRFQTEAGLRVGMSEDELLARHPDATTRGGDPSFDDEFGPSGTLYGLEQMASPIATTGILPTLKALVRNGQVVGLEVTPLLGGD